MSITGECMMISSTQKGVAAILFSLCGFSLAYADDATFHIPPQSLTGA
jgi:hypothetical protein